MAQGLLQIDVVSDVNNFPITDAKVSIADKNTPDKILEELTTDRAGQTEAVLST